MGLLKKIVQYALQKIAGIRCYLFCFGLYRALLKLLIPDASLQLFVKLAVLKKGDIIDIGANVGTNSIYYAKKIPHKKVIGFEPLALLVETSEKLISWFKLQNCIIIPEGVGDKNESLSLFTPILHGVFMHGLTHVKPEINDNDRVVPIQTLDTYYQATNKKAIAAIKIDVENHELFVIKGAFEVLTNERPFVFMELWENEKKQLSESTMQQLGYTQMVIEKGKLVLANSKKVNDYFFIPNECVELVNL